MEHIPANGPIMAVGADGRVVIPKVLAGPVPQALVIVRLRAPPLKLLP